MSEEVRSPKLVVKQLTPEQVTRFAELLAESEEFFKRARVSQATRTKELQEIAGPKNNFELSEDGGFMLIRATTINGGNGI